MAVANYINCTIISDWPMPRGMATFVNLLVGMWGMLTDGPQIYRGLMSVGRQASALVTSATDLVRDMTPYLEVVIDRCGSAQESVLGRIFGCQAALRQLWAAVYEPLMELYDQFIQLKVRLAVEVWPLVIRAKEAVVTGWLQVLQTYAVVSGLARSVVDEQRHLVAVLTVQVSFREKGF